MSYRYMTAPWGPYCWGCGGSGNKTIDDVENFGENGETTEDCIDCAATGRAPIPWSELFTHGGKHPPISQDLFRWKR